MFIEPMDQDVNTPKEWAASNKKKKDQDVDQISVGDPITHNTGVDMVIQFFC